MVCEVCTFLKDKKQLILIINKKSQDFWFLNGAMHHVVVNGAVWSKPLIFLTH